MSSLEQEETMEQMRDRLLPDVLTYAKIEGLSEVGIASAALRFGIQAARASRPVSPQEPTEAAIDASRNAIHRVMASEWAVIASALKMDQAQYDSFLTDLARAALSAAYAVRGGAQ